MKVVMPLPHVVQVFLYEKQLLEISCNDREIARKVYDHFCFVYYVLFNRTGEVTKESFEKYLKLFEQKIEIDYLNPPDDFNCS